MRKKISLTIIALMLIITIHAQEKGLYITGAGHLGGTSLGYKVDDTWSKFGLGYGGTIGIQYFFNYNWGIAGGVGLSCYKSSAKYNGEFTYEGLYDLDGLVTGDPMGEYYNLQLGLGNWKETQKAYFLEIPIMAMYQKKWGLKQSVGMYFGLGVKLQLPIISQEYEVNKGSELSVSGYYPQSDLTIDDLPARGFGKTIESGYKGDMDLKLGLAGTAELGLLFRLSSRVDLTLGAYVDYGFLNMKKGNKTEQEYLIGPNEGANTIHPASYVGDNLQYNGYVNSSIVDRVNPLSIGGKLGIRVKLGKIEDRRKAMSEEAEQQVLIAQDQQKKQDTMFQSLKRIENLLDRLVNKDEMDKLITYLDAQKEKEQEKSKEQEGRPTADEKRSLKEHVFFDLNSSKLRPASKEVLDRKVSLLTRYPEAKIRVLGNTCNRGSERINIPLGLKRAEEVKKYLIANGIEASRIIAISQSDYNPMLPNSNEENRAFNRRVDFEVIYE
ncbi:OmpA family protein [Bacteroides sp. UBA939]|uniref:OmpA family protein n=1 Tax=Bacteroides sp. UBA939 TaxID=1946092 RepID=UPI0025B87C7E|nr:OmpA family protein [Bacteroides sp. UBA939]